MLAVCIREAEIANRVIFHELAAELPIDDAACSTFPAIHPITRTKYEIIPNSPY